MARRLLTLAIGLAGLGLLIACNARAAFPVAAPPSAASSQESEPPQSTAPPSAQPAEAVEPYVVFGSCAIRLEVADSPAERARGLSGRLDLPKDRGMVFVYAESNRWGFWMKDTLIPLDIVWMDKDFTVVDVQTMMPEPGVPDDRLRRYEPGGNALYVLEVQAGLAGGLGVRPGQRLVLALSPVRTPDVPACA